MSSECHGDPRQWLRDYQKRIEQVGRQAENVKRNIGGVQGHAADGSGVAVTVGSGGRIEAIDIPDEVLRLDAHALSALITRTIVAAQVDAAGQVHNSLSDLTGEGPAMDYVKGYLDGGKRSLDT